MELHVVTVFSVNRSQSLVNTSQCIQVHGRVQHAFKRLHKLSCGQFLAMPAILAPVEKAFSLMICVICVFPQTCVLKQGYCIVFCITHVEMNNSYSFSKQMALSKLHVELSTKHATKYTVFNICKHCAM